MYACIFISSSDRLCLASSRMAESTLRPLYTLSPNPEPYMKKAPGTA